MSTNRYNTHILQLEKAQKSKDYESAHFIRDKIYKKFIKDINNNKLTSLEDIQGISKLLCEKTYMTTTKWWYS